MARSELNVSKITALILFVGGTIVYWVDTRDRVSGTQFLVYDCFIFSFLTNYMIYVNNFAACPEKLEISHVKIVNWLSEIRIQNSAHVNLILFFSEVMQLISTSV